MSHPADLSGLAEAATRGQVVRLEREGIDPHPLEGYLVGQGRRFLLMHLVAPELRLDGYTAARRRDLTGWSAVPEDESVVSRVLRLRGQGPCPIPGLPLDDLPALLGFASVRFPLVTIHYEATRPDECSIGRVERVTPAALVLRLIDPRARWIGAERIPLREITRVDFGGPYEENLALLAAHDALASPRPPDGPGPVRTDSPLDN